MTKRVVEDAKEPWVFRITPRHIEIAKAEIARLRSEQGDVFCPPTKTGIPSVCVVSQAVMAALGPIGGDLFEGIETGTRIVHIYLKGREIRYATPDAIRKAVLRFDDTLEWDLPPGEYTLLPPPPSMRLDYVAPPHKKKNRKNRRRNPTTNKATPGRRAMKSGMLNAECLPG